MQLPIDYADLDRVTKISRSAKNSYLPLLCNRLEKVFIVLPSTPNQAHDTPECILPNFKMKVCEAPSTKSAFDGCVLKGMSCSHFTCDY